MKSRKPRRTFSWMNPKLKIQTSEKYGKAITAVPHGASKVYRKISQHNKAVFATGHIEKGQILFVLGGYIMTLEDDNNSKGIVADKPIELSDIFFMGPLKPSDIDLMPQSYVNHSCDPNAGFDGQIVI